MIKVVLLMVLCSGIVENSCKVIPTHTVLFEDYHDCMVYGYDYSHKIMTEFNREWVNSIEAYTKFSCREEEII